MMAYQAEKGAKWIFMTFSQVRCKHLEHFFLKDEK